MIRDWTSNSSGSDVGTLRLLFWRSLFASQLEGKHLDDLEATSDRSCSNGLDEPISVHTYIAFPGYAEAAAVADVSAISFSLDGFIEYGELASEMGPGYSCSPPQVVTRATCTSRGHRVILTRR